MQYKCINESFFVQNTLLKGSYMHSFANVDLDHLVVFVKKKNISLLLDRIFWKMLQITWHPVKGNLTHTMYTDGKVH